MGLNSVAPLQALQAIVQNLPSMQGTVKVGQPESNATRVTAWITLGGHGLLGATTGTRDRETRYVVFLAYRVGGAEETAELVMAGLADTLEQTIIDDPTINETVDDASIVSAGAELPEYIVIAAQEFRIYPIVIKTKQTTGFSYP